MNKTAAERCCDLVKKGYNVLIIQHTNEETQVEDVYVDSYLVILNGSYVLTIEDNMSDELFKEKLDKYVIGEDSLFDKRLIPDVLKIHESNKCRYILEPTRILEVWKD